MAAEPANTLPALYRTCKFITLFISTSCWVPVQRQMNPVHIVTLFLEGSIEYDCPIYTKILNSLMFCWPCITVYQYSETNVMHFLFSLLRIKDRYVLSITCSSSGGTTQMALGILHVCYVSWPHQEWSGTSAANWNTHTIHQVPFA
jgi:hypothetical protein